MRERLPGNFYLPPTRPTRRLRFRVANPELLFGFGASALLVVAIFVFHLPHWLMSLAGGILALWFISMALTRMQQNLSPRRDEPKQTAADCPQVDE